MKFKFYKHTKISSTDRRRQRLRFDMPAKHLHHKSRNIKTYILYSCLETTIIIIPTVCLLQ